MVTTLRLASVLAIFMITGCAASGPTIRDYQVITQALHADARQAQRTIMDLEAQREALQRDLGEARTARARLEGNILDAERRLLEARHLVDLQREELARALEERQGVAQTAREVQAQLQAQLEAQLMEVGRLRQQVADAQSKRENLQTMDEAFTQQANEMAELKAAVREALRVPAIKPAALDAPTFRLSATVTPVAVYSDQTAGLSRSIIVRRGDSLWALAHRHGISLDELIALNRLKRDIIVPGQTLLLPDPAP
jgi:LysM repeat protein